MVSDSTNMHTREEDTQPALSPATATVFSLPVDKYNFNLLPMSCLFRLILVSIPIACDSRKKSPIELNPPFMIISIVTTFVTVIASLVLIFAKYYYLKVSWTWYICLTIVKSIGSFGMYAANLSLYMVAYVSPNHNWIGYILICLIFGYTFAYYYIWHLDNTADYGSTNYAKFYFLGLFHIPLSLVLIFFLPENLGRIVISLMMVCWFLEITASIIYSNYKKGGPNNVRVCNLEAHREDTNDDLRRVDASCKV